jgi:hypothetical protein
MLPNRAHSVNGDGLTNDGGSRRLVRSIMKLLETRSGDHGTSGDCAPTAQRLSLERAWTVSARGRLS